VNRRELFERAGIIEPSGPRLHKRTIKAHMEFEQAQLNEGFFHSSFWGGSFPAVEKPCGRLAMYKLMNLPETDPATPKLAATSHQGLAAEAFVTKRWAAAGMSLVHPKLPSDKQLRLKDSSIWLSSAIDDVLDLRPDWDCVTPVDVKSKADRIIDEMRHGTTSWQPEHRAQVVCYTYLCRLHHVAEGWDALGLRPAEGGFLYYVSRDNPAHGIELWVEYNEDEVVEAVATLAVWQENFLNEKLPPRDKNWRWMETPCKWCDFKKVCKDDMRNGVEELKQSRAIELALAADPQYNFDEVKKKVTKRWEGS
jgi:CRISPR/Cas system-associated exonuclease Cas4 (RecB family)